MFINYQGEKRNGAKICVDYALDEDTWPIVIDLDRHKIFLSQNEAEVLCAKLSESLNALTKRDLDGLKPI